MTPFSAARAIDEETLGIVSAEIHDAFIDVDELVVDGVDASVPLSRGRTRRRLVGFTSRLGEVPTWDAQLVVHGVSNVFVKDDQAIGTYSINQLTFDVDSGTISVLLNAAASIVFLVAGVDVEIRVLTR